MEIDEHIDFVNRMIAFQLSQAERFSKQPSRAELHIDSAEHLGRISTLLTELKSKPLFKTKTSPHPSGEAVRLSLVWDEIEGLPPELLEELSISESDKTEFRIVALINEMGGVASLDRLLVAIYRSTNEIMKRTTLNQRLYRMSQKNMVFSIAGKKGIYTTRELDEEESKNLPTSGPLESVPSPVGALKLY